MENKRGESPQTVDAEADLALLDRAKRSVAVDQFMDFGPWWYGPLFATMFAGLTLFQAAVGFAQSLMFGAAGLGSATFIAFHDYRRRGVRWPVTHRSIGSLVGVALGVVVTFVVIGLWGTAVSTIGYADFVPWYLMAGWLLTTAFYLGARAFLGRLRAAKTSLV